MDARKAGIFFMLGLTVTVTPAAAQPAWPDTFLARLEALALVETLNATLLASNSATKTLEDWCAVHHMASDPAIHARLSRDVQKSISAEQRKLLNIGPDEPVIYRRVELACGDHVLSRADNWYVPGRLTPAMDHALATTDTPFGSAVKDLHPRRRTIAVTVFWHPLADGWEMAAPAPDHPGQKLDVPPSLFEHRALVFSGKGDPISEVDETYTSDILDFSIGQGH